MYFFSVPGRIPGAERFGHLWVIPDVPVKLRISIKNTAISDTNIKRKSIVFERRGTTWQRSVDE